MYALSLYAAKGDWKHNSDKITAYRAVIFEKDDETGALSVHDIMETNTLIDLQGYFCCEYVDRALVTAVHMPDGSWEYPDCLSVWEAAEAAYSFPVDLFDQDPLQKK